MTAVIDLRVERRGDGWVLTGSASDDVRLVNDYLGYLGDRRYAQGTRRGYAFDLLAFLRWLAGRERRLEQVDTPLLLEFLASCRAGSFPAPAAGGESGRGGLAAATVNRRLAAVSGLFAFRTMRNASTPNPMPKGAAARRVAGGARDGLLGHLARPQPRSALRVRQPRPLPRALEPEEATALLESLRSWRDRAIAGLARRPTEFLLLHQGRRVSAQALREQLTRACTTAGLEKITPHALRHTYATALVNAGVSLQALMQLLGHVSATMSLRYGRLSLRDEVSASPTADAGCPAYVLITCLPRVPYGPSGRGSAP